MIRAVSMVRCTGGALLAVVAAAGMVWADTGGDGTGPQIRTERLQQAQEAEERAQGERTDDGLLEGAEMTDEREDVEVNPKPHRLDAEQIAGVLTAQQDAWNRGDIDAFMTGYWKSDDLRFASGGTVTKGWQATLDRYRKRYDSREKMGRLSFSGLDISVLSGDAALAFGRWTLERAGDKPTGLFSLLFRKIDGKWVIVHDHTSSE